MISQKNNSHNIEAGIILVIIILLIWGLIGSFVSKDPGITCDVPLSDYFCFIWHKNLLGSLEEIAKDSAKETNNQPSNQRYTPSQTDSRGDYTCAELLGDICSNGYSCQGESVIAKDGLCCRGFCRP